MRRWMAVLLLPVVVLAACGDDDDDTSEAVGEEVEETTSTTDAESSASPFGDEADHTLTIDDNESELAVAVGETIDVVLETCPSCGYAWHVMGDDGGGVLELVEEADGPSSNAEGEVGGTVDHWVRFRAASGGTVELALGYFPPADDAPEEVFTVTVQVAPEGDEVNDITVFDGSTDGSTQQVSVGSSFDIALEQCIGCGYQWRVITEPDAAVVTLSGEGESGGPEQVEGEPPIVGGMNEHVWHYDVVGAGSTTIELGYFPPGRDAPEETFLLTVEAS